jgi:hypothetical protein
MRSYDNSNLYKYVRIFLLPSDVNNKVNRQGSNAYAINRKNATNLISFKKAVTQVSKFCDFVYFIFLNNLPLLTFSTSALARYAYFLNKKHSIGFIETYKAFFDISTHKAFFNKSALARFNAKLITIIKRRSGHIILLLGGNAFSRLLSTLTKHQLPTLGMSTNASLSRELLLSIFSRSDTQAQTLYFLRLLVTYRIRAMKAAFTAASTQP